MVSESIIEQDNEYVFVLILVLMEHGLGGQYFPGIEKAK